MGKLTHVHENKAKTKRSFMIQKWRKKKIKIDS